MKIEEYWSVWFYLFCWTVIFKGALGGYFDSRALFAALSIVSTTVIIVVFLENERTKNEKKD